jgi:hypothetical protein
MNGALSTTSVQTAINLSNNSDLIMFDIETNGTAQRNNYFTHGNQDVNITIHTFTVDNQSHGSGLFAVAGKNLNIVNGTINNCRP